MTFTAEAMYGCAPNAPTAGIAAPTGPLATTDVRTGWRGVVDINNPLLWLGAIVLITAGLIGFSSSVKAGPVKAAVAAGSS